MVKRVSDLKYSQIIFSYLEDQKYQKDQQKSLSMALTYLI